MNLSFIVSMTFIFSISPYNIGQIKGNDNSPTISIIVHMKEQFNISNIKSGVLRSDKIILLQKYANIHQQNIMGFLSSKPEEVEDLRSFWIFNGLSLKTTKSILQLLAKRDDIDIITLDSSIVLDETKFKQITTSSNRDPGWNIKIIEADSCWSAGYTGANVVIGTLDSGIDTSHAAVRGKWVPGGWYDAVNGYPYPYDDLGHGLFTMGIICGGDGLGPSPDDIGVAPDVKFICAKAFDSIGAATLSDVHNSFQWLATQGARIICCPWEENSTTSLEFWNDCLNLRTLNKIPVFKIGTRGNAPPNSAKTPGNYPFLFGIGTTDSLDDRVNWSCRGPAPNQNPWNDTTYWIRQDWNFIKPDIVAPGISIRSATPGGGYGFSDGTAWSAAHAAGALAILLQKDSLLNINDLAHLLDDNADHPAQGSPYPNNDYGWGRLNIYASLQHIPNVNEAPGGSFPSYFSLHPSIFRGKLYINMLSSQNDEININIYDIGGRAIRKIIIPIAGNPNMLDYVWDGTDDKNQSVPSGVVLIEYTCGNKKEVKKAIIVR